MAHQLLLFVAAAAWLGTALLLAVEFLSSTFSIYLLILLIFGWLFYGYLLFREFSLIKILSSISSSLTLEKPNSFSIKALKTLLGSLERLFQASRVFEHLNDDSETSLSRNLRQVAQMAYDELQAQSVELALKDEASGQKTQSFLIGVPKSSDSQAFLIDAGLSSAKNQRVLDNVFSCNLTFAHTTFGRLYVELPAGRVPTAFEKRITELLATQGALLLVDAQFTQELLRMRKLSDESQKAKTGFLANLSHEIRGPLGTILNGVELVVEGLCGPTTAQQVETLTMVKNSGSHLLDLVNDVLDYAKVEAGKVKAKPVEISVAELLKDLSGVVRAQAIAKQHILKVEPVPANLGIFCDKRHARQMVINLLTNAIKYTPNGGSITLSAEEVDDYIDISVTDTGVGIPKSERHKVFGAFERVENEYSMRQNGSGLGMPLTKKLAEVNGGEVDFESSDGAGSTFWLLLPKRILEDEIEEDSSETESGVLYGQGETILLIEHERETREMLGTYLRHQGFNVLSAENGPAVLKILKESPIHLAVVENDLPDLPGEEMVRAIRTSKNANGVPVILLSSRAFVFDIEHFLKLGVDRCLSKPVSLSELAKTSRKLLDEVKSLSQ